MPFGIKFTRVNLICIVVLLFLFSICFAETVVLKSGKVLEGNITEDTEEFIKIETTDGKSLYLYKNTIEIIKKDGEEATSSVASTQVSLRTGLLDYSDKGYMLFVPKNISAVSPTSILICLPGWGIRAKQDIYNWAFVAGKRNFVVMDLDVDYSRIRPRELYLRISNIIASLAQEYPVSQDKIYIAGTSAGGIMSIALALHYPDKFVAVGVVSGGRLGFGAEHYLKNANGIHFYMVHGQRDRAISIGEFYSTKKKLAQNGAIIESKALPQGEHTLPSHVYREAVDWLSGVR